MNKLKIIRKFWKIDKMYVLSVLLKKLIDIPQPILSSLYLKYLIDKLSDDKSFASVVYLLIFFCVLQLTMTYLKNFMEIKYKAKSQEKISKKLTEELLKKNIKIPLKYFENKEFCDKSSLTINELSTTYFNLFHGFFDILASIFSMISLVTFILMFDKLIIFLSFVILLLYFAINTMHNKLKIRQQKEMISIERKSKYFFSILNQYNNVRNLRAYQAESFFIDKWKANCDDKINKIVSFSKKHLTYINLNSSFSLIFQYTVALYMSKLVFAGRLSIGSFSALTQSVVSFMQQMRCLVDIFINVKHYSYYLEIIESLDSYLPQKKDMPNLLILDKNKSHTIEFKRLNFSYPNSPELIFEDISFKINANEKIAIIGKNGSGKSTLINLLLRLYEPPKNSIFIDNVDITEYNINSLRKNFAVIMQAQDSYALTVAENITLQQKSNILNYKKIESALRLSGLYKKITQSKYGIDSEVTKNFSNDGLQLSGGEIQKLNISRFLNRDAPILILDEFNRWLDNESDLEIFKNISKSAINKTLILISHDEKIFNQFDRVYILKNGKLIKK